MMQVLMTKWSVSGATAGQGTGADGFHRLLPGFIANARSHSDAARPELKHIYLHLWIIPVRLWIGQFSGQVDDVERSGVSRIGWETCQLPISIFPVSQNVRSERAPHACC